MPGVSLKCDMNKEIRNHNGECDGIFLKALNSIMHNDYYKLEILLNEDPYIIGSTKYPEYPVKTFESSEYWICFEGKVYGKQDFVLREEIYALMKRIFKTGSYSQGDKKIISDWLFGTDGDFVIYALDKKSKDLAIMNDILGRLPIYYAHKGGRELLVSRELQFISYLVHDIYDNHSSVSKFDMMGIAQFLLFCHTLGRRTLLTDIYRLEPASLLRIFNDNSEIRIDTLYQYDFENKKYVNDSLKKSAEKLVTLFSEGCGNRVDTSTKNVITLSGGFDSRTIASWFNKNKIPAYAVTTNDPTWKPFVGNLSDTEVAKIVATSLNIPWEYYHFNESRAGDLDMLLRIKKGLSYLGYGFLIQFVDKLIHSHGSSAMNVFVGYSGDRILADISSNFASLDELTSSILAIRTFLPIDEVAALVQIKENEIVDEIRNTLTSYPEKNLAQKLVHFLFYGRQFKFIFEAEDIHRLYFWIVNPFYSIPFFNYAMNCDDKHKSKQALYREFLFLLSPLAATIKNSNWGCSILSKKFRIIQFTLSLISKYPILKKFLKKNSRDVKGYDLNAKIIKCMREQLNNCSDISNYMSCSEINKIMVNCSNYRPTGIDNLFTIMSLMERTLCNNCTIEKFYEN